MRRSLAALAALLAAAASAQPDAALRARMKAFPPVDRAVEAIEAYTPAETVRGGRGRPLPTSPATAFAPEALAAADALADRHGSFALLVLKDGRLVHARYGQGFGPASRFSTASMHKTVMALAFGAAGARIRPDDPIGRHLREWRQDPRGEIPLRRFLEMTSGLAIPAGDSPLPTSARLLFSADSRAVVTAARPVAAPGTVFAYANSESQLAGLALTEAIGRRYAAFLSERVWRPLGAADAALWLDREAGNPHLFCCLQATAPDWARVGELIRREGRVGGRQVVPAAWVRAMAAPSPRNPNYGLHLWRGSPHTPERRYSAASPLVIPAREPFAADDVLFLDGAGGQRVYVVPSKGLTIVRIGRPALTWDDSELPNILIRGLRS
jgi:CubicO group peptidase (beta-lactamase class C family)